MELLSQARVKTKILTILVLAGTFLCRPAVGQKEQQGSSENTVEAVLKIRKFSKLDGPPRLGELETVLPQVLKASFFRYRWLSVSMEQPSAMLDSDGSAPSGNTRSVPSYVLDGTFVAFEDQIRLDVSLTNAAENGGSAADFRSFEVFGEDTLLEAADRLGQRIAEFLTAKTAGRAKEHHTLFGIDSTFQYTAGDPVYTSLGPLLSSAIFGQLSAVKISNVSFQRVDVGRAKLEGTRSDAMLTGEYKVSGNEIQFTAKLREMTGASYVIESRGALDQIPQFASGVSNRVLEIVRGRVTPMGTWRVESISLEDAKPEAYLAEAKKYQEAKEFAPAIVMYRKAIEKNASYLEARSGLAELYMTEGDYPSAISEYKEILRLNSKDVSALLGLGAAYVKSGNSRAALEQAEEAQQIGVNEPQARAQLYRIRGDANLLEGKPQDAIQQYRRGLEVSEGSPELYHSIARAYRASADLNQAIEFLNKARQLYPGDPEFTVDLVSIYNQLGRQYYVDGEYQKALQAFENALSLPARDRQLEAEAMAYRGVIVGHFLPKSDLENGIADLKKSVELDPNKEWSHRCLGALYEEAKKYPEALESLKQGIAVEPTPNSYREMAVVYRLMKNYEAAQEAIQQALKLNPGYANGYAELALIYQSSRDLDRAVDALRKYLTLEPKSAWGFSTLGSTYADKGDPDKAVENLKKAAELEPSAAAYVALGNLYIRKEDYAQAIEANRQALKLEPRDTNAYESLEQIYKAKKDAAGFTEMLRQAVKADPEFAWGHTKLGAVYEGAGKHDEAVASLKRALALDPKSRWATELLAMVYVDKQKYDLAEEMLQTSLANEPSKWGYSELGKVYLLKHEPEKAIEPLQQALKIDGEYTDAYGNLESVYVALGQPQSSISLLEEAAKKYPDFAWAYAELGKVYAYEGNYEQAIQNLQKALEIKPSQFAFEQLADVYELKEDWPKEREVSKRLLEFDPKAAIGYGLLARSYTYANDPDYVQALQAIQHGLAVSPDSAYLLSVEADIYRLEKKYPDAIELCQKAIQLSPEYFYPYSVLAKIQLEQGAYEKAAGSARTSIDAGGEDYALLCEVYKRLNRDDEAVRTLSGYLANSPKNANLMEALASVYHERLYLQPSAYEQAYKLDREAYQLQLKTLQFRENLAEASLTTKRYDDALRLANEVLTDNSLSLSPDQKLSVKLIQIASLVFEKRDAEAFSELGEFIRYYDSIGKDYSRSWVFEGTKNFIRLNGSIDGSSRAQLLNLIEILELPKVQADAKFRELKEFVNRSKIYSSPQPAGLATP